MIRNRNGYWMSPKWFALFAPDGGDGGNGSGAGADAGTDGNGGDGTGDAGNGADGDSGTGDDGGNDDSTAEIARLKAELARQKAAIDKATKEAAQYKRDLRAKQSAEEIAAEEKKAADEKAAQEIEELRREVARTKAVKAVMSRLGTDEEASGKVAEYLYGAEDIDAALTEIQKAWMAKEKALKLEYGKVPPPGAGGNGENDPDAKGVEMAKNIGKARAQVNDAARKALDAYIR